MTAEKAKVDKRKLRGQESRSQILQAAIVTIAQLGLGNMTLDRVAERAGSSRGLVVFHFKSKNRLIEEVLHYLGSQYADGWDAVANKPGTSTLDKLLQLVDYDVDFCFLNPDYVSAWHAFWGEARGNTLYQTLSLPRDEHYERKLEQLLASLLEETGQQTDELMYITAGLGSMMYGVWMEAHQDPESDSQHADFYKKTLRLYLGKVFPGLGIKLSPDRFAPV